MTDKRVIEKRDPQVLLGQPWARILVQVTIYRRLRIGRDGHLDQSKAYDISYLAREYGPLHDCRPRVYSAPVRRILTSLSMICFGKHKVKDLVAGRASQA